MSSSGINAANPTGRGFKFPKLDSVCIIRGGAAVVGGVYMLAEDADIAGDATQDSASVTDENGTGIAGTRSNAVAPSAAAVAGLTNAAATELAVFVLALEAAADGFPFRCAVEVYYADALVTTTTAIRPPRSALFPRTNADLHETRSGIGSPAIGRLLQEAAIAGPVLRKVHFCGLPGGFANGPGTT